MSLQLGARELGVQMSRSEARAILRRLTTLAGGPVDRYAFYKALEVDISTDRVGGEEGALRKLRRERDAERDGNFDYFESVKRSVEKNRNRL